MVSVPAPRLFQYIALSHMIFFPEVLDVTMMAALPSSARAVTVFKMTEAIEQSNIKDRSAASSFFGRKITTNLLL